jgi:ribosomal protein S18 acetylase RimI-like enzyme
VTVLRLREPREAEGAALASWFASPEELRRFAGPAARWPLDQEQIHRWHADPAIHAWSAEARDIPGVLQGYVHVVRAEADVGRLARVAIAPAARGRGWGRELVGAAIDRAAELGFRRLTLKVYVDNEPARRLYRSVGFSELGPDAGDPELVDMGLELSGAA